MRLAFLTWRDTQHPDGGGSEVFVEQVAQRLAARGHEVTILCARPAGAAASGRLGEVAILRTGGRLTVYPRGLWWLWRNRRDVDVVVDVINGLPFGTPLVRRRGIVALVHHAHQRQWQIIYPGVRGRIGWLVEHRLTPWLYRSVPHVTVSQASRADLEAMGISRRRISIAYNGAPAAGAPVPRSATPRLSVLARLVPHKQIEHVLEVAARLRSELPDLRVDLIGDGWWREELEQAAERLGVTDVVTFHGRVDDAVRDRLLAESWLMLLPSVKEGWGIAVMEAAAQRTPTVAYRWAGGVAESVVDGETGLLADDLDDLTEQTRRVLTDAELRERLGRQAAAHAASFDWETTADVVEQAADASRVRSGRRS